MMNNDKDNIFNTDITNDLPESIRKQIVKRMQQLSTKWLILKTLNDCGDKKSCELFVGLYRLYKVETTKQNIAQMCAYLQMYEYITRKRSVGRRNTNAWQITEKGKQKMMEVDYE